MKKVLIITYYWPPSGGAGVQRWVKLSKYLAELNLEIHVLTVDEKYASYTSSDKSLIKDINPKVIVHKTKSFEILKLYGKIAGKNKVPSAGFSNVNVNSKKQKLINFIRSNFFIPDPRKGWNKYAYQEAKKIIATYNIETIITSSPPHSTQLIGYKLKMKYNIKWIADFRDPWTDIYYYNILNHSRISDFINKNYERKVLEKSDNIITVSNSIGELFNQKSPKIQKNKIHIIPNGFDYEDFKDRKINKSDKFIITYTGTMSSLYEPQIIFQAISELINENKIKNLLIQFIGSISNDILSYIKKLNLKEYLVLLDTVPHDEIIDFQLNSTLLLLVIPNVQNSNGILTGKIFEYLATNNPILCLGPENGDAAEIIEQCNAGKTFNRNQINDIKEYLVTEYQSFISSKTIDQNENINLYNRELQALKIFKEIL
ncbi:MAG: glycosyltransferase family 4 protein [Saprospiraceae bacterium]